MQCVHCGTDLVPEAYEEATVDRCPGCQGVWLDSGELSKIVETMEVPMPDETVQDTLAVAFEGVPQDEQARLRRCPKCGAAMHTVNYDYSSGVILDRCPKGHGIWLDGGELEKVQAHAEYWADKVDKEAEEWESYVAAVVKQRTRAADENRKWSLRLARYLINSIIRRCLGS